MRLVLIATTPLLLLGACDRSAPDGGQQPAQVAASPYLADPMAADDTAAPASPETDPRPLMQAQVVLDRLGFTPGVIDGKEGLSTRNALSGFQEANNLPVTGELDPATVQKLATWRTIPATRVITIPQDFAAGPFAPLPDDPAVQARLPAMGFASLDEKLAERFHTTIETLVMLNPGAGAPTPASGQPAPASGQPGAAPAQPAFSAGQQIRVPNVGHDRIELAKFKDNAEWQSTLASLGVGTEQPDVDRVVVSKSKGTLKAFDKAGKLVAVYTATMGSQNDPLPLGNWKVNGVARNPKFHYNPDLFWDASPGDKAAMLPPGPNSPVGVVWIDLSKEHYGIHGTPRPETIGRAESHGCVRLTNWDAARLSLMVKPGTKVEFVA